MNVRLTPLARPHCTLQYGGIRVFVMDDDRLTFVNFDGTSRMLLRRDYGRMDLDDDPGGFD